MSLPRMLAGVLCAGGLLVPSACGPPAVEDAPPERPPDDAAEAPEVAVCLRGEPFDAEGPIDVRLAREADGARVSALRWQAHEGCERFVVDVAGEDGAAARSPGRVRAQVLRELGVVRVELLDVGAVAPEATEETFGGSLARAAYLVSSPSGGWMYVDLHLGGAAEAHVGVLEEPGRVVVDLRPGGGPVPPRAPAGARVVVLAPRPGPSGYPLTVTGYARTFEANVVVRLEQDGEDRLETFTTATAWVDAWGHYSVEVAEGPAGPVVLHVGEYSARDGTWEGVAVELEMRQ